MKKPRTIPKVLLALSVNSAALAFDVQRRHIWNAIESGHVVPRNFGASSRLLVSELVAYFYTSPVTPRRKRKTRNAPENE